MSLFSRRSFLSVFGFGALLSGVLTGPGALYAGEQSPEELIRHIYQTYMGAKAKGYDWNEPKAARAAFSTEVVKLILDDARKHRDDIGALDFDPIIDAQDYKISDLKIVVHAVDATHANADVSFVNFGDLTKLKMLLIKQKDGWRIDDIVWSGEDRGSLRSVYLDALKN